MGSEIITNTGLLKINVQSSLEFGNIKNIVIKKGIIGENMESQSFTIQNINKYNLNIKLKVYTSKKCYYRCEGEFINKEGKKNIAFTNPIWLKPKR